MKKILSSSKMRETLPLPHVEGKAKSAVFLKGEITELSDVEYKFLIDQKNGPFNFLINEGTFKLISETKEEEPEQRQLSKKEKKKLAAEEKVKAEKLAAEVKASRQGK